MLGRALLSAISSLRLPSSYWLQERPPPRSGPARRAQQARPRPSPPPRPKGLAARSRPLSPPRSQSPRPPPLTLPPHGARTAAASTYRGRRSVTARDTTRPSAPPLIPSHRPAPVRSPPPVAPPLPPARANRVRSSLGRPSSPIANPRCSYGRQRSARNCRAQGRRAGRPADR